MEPKRQLVVSPTALEQYRSRVAASPIPSAEARRDLASALARPLFAVPGKDGATLYGLVDPYDVRFLALVSRDGDLVAVGPPHHWLEAKAGWASVGWDVRLNRQKTGGSPGVESPPNQGVNCRSPSNWRQKYVNVGEVPPSALSELLVAGARDDRGRIKARRRDMAAMKRIMDAHGGTLSESALNALEGYPA